MERKSCVRGQERRKIKKKDRKKEVEEKKQNPQQRAHARGPDFVI